MEQQPPQPSYPQQPATPPRRASRATVSSRTKWAAAGIAATVTATVGAALVVGTLSSQNAAAQTSQLGAQGSLPGAGSGQADAASAQQLRAQYEQALAQMNQHYQQVLAQYGITDNTYRSGDSGSFGDDAQQRGGGQFSQLPPSSSYGGGIPGPSTHGS